MFSPEKNHIFKDMVLRGLFLKEVILPNNLPLSTKVYPTIVESYLHKKVTAKNKDKMNNTWRTCVFIVWTTKEDMKNWIKDEFFSVKNLIFKKNHKKGRVLVPFKKHHTAL